MVDSVSQGPGPAGDPHIPAGSRDWRSWYAFGLSGTIGYGVIKGLINDQVHGFVREKVARETDWSEQLRNIDEMVDYLTPEEFQ